MEKKKKKSVTREKILKYARSQSTPRIIKKGQLFNKYDFTQKDVLRDERAEGITPEELEEALNIP